MSEFVLPPIERWWPQLDIEFKHEILADLDAPLSAPALAQLVHLCGEDPEAGPAALSEREKAFILTQIEVVD